MSDDDSDVDIVNPEVVPKDTWISWFCSLDGHEYLTEVEVDYLTNPHNLLGLKKAINSDKYE